MTDAPFHINAFQKADKTTIWEWKRRSNEDNQVSEFLQESKQKLEEAVVGPGAGAGIGCGMGLGWGVAGGMGIAGGSEWNQLKIVFGIGMGCGLGVGIGYGQGVGVGLTLESIKSHLFTNN
ncbi:hypothetical protein LIER_24031 [Lithospermum erythrorhizon]|uniref:Uncharacterized protein n=1 Tax=Lithospermum erythrorhizon TaxID=34254 RepID=A0AAV3R3D0_LITER